MSANNEEMLNTIICLSCVGGERLKSGLKRRWFCLHRVEMEWETKAPALRTTACERKATKEEIKPKDSRISHTTRKLFKAVHA